MAAPHDTDLTEVFVRAPAAKALHSERQAGLDTTRTALRQLWQPPLSGPAESYAFPGERSESAHARHAAASEVAGSLDAALSELTESAYAEAFSQAHAAVRSGGASSSASAVVSFAESSNRRPSSSIVPAVLLCSPGTIADAEQVMPGLIKQMKRE